MAAQYTFQLWFYTASQDCFFSLVIRHYRGRYHRLCFSPTYDICTVHRILSLLLYLQTCKGKSSWYFLPFFWGGGGDGGLPLPPKKFMNHIHRSRNDRVLIRETRKGCPLLTVETEVNGSSNSTNKRGPSLVCSLGLSCPYMRFLCCLSCSKVGPVQNICFLTGHYFNSYIPRSASCTLSLPSPNFVPILSPVFDLRFKLSAISDNRRGRSEMRSRLSFPGPVCVSADEAWKG